MLVGQLRKFNVDVRKSFVRSCKMRILPQTPFGAAKAIVIVLALMTGI